MNIYEEALKLHEEHKGKVAMVSKVQVNDRKDLSLAYTPGVAEPCRKIAEKKDDVYKYTSKGNTVAVITDGTAVLGLGDIGPEAGLPVMEGKCLLFKRFAGIDAFPICLDTKDTEEIIKTIKLISPSLGGINLEDISAPRCVEIETRLKEELNIPVFHDDQHGTAIVVTAGLINAFKFLNKKFEDVKIVVSGAGAAGSSICKLLHQMGTKEIVAVDIDGVLNRDDIETYNPLKKDLMKFLNPNNIKGGLKEAIVGADAFIGVSAPKLLTKEMVATMNKDSVVFAMANPEPEILPDEAKAGGARIIGTGRSDYPNQINNILAFPGIFRGALDSRASQITEEMKIAAAKGIAAVIKDEELREDYIIPDVFDERVVKVVAKSVSDFVLKNK
ncbi:NADP-dependent malic enzyme [Fusobacterium sp. FSA-380-WT-3A]|uniref:NAD(P)-dependent malic enzyme n=1 Tax=Fusobacterium sp. FSA-380-WT-3A TaxID=2725304 RepID=UPI0014770EA3|nr:NADP-dependent malic enzyme [Fusobacterium sp. FSA-380-WT-3A]NME35203.1 NADP-dependent malic enzyme [Fusobacterium sp. FSA-380-WT-3A]